MKGFLALFSNPSTPLHRASQADPEVILFLQNEGLKGTYRKSLIRANFFHLHRLSVCTLQPFILGSVDPLSVPLSSGFTTYEGSEKQPFITLHNPSGSASTLDSRREPSSFLVSCNT